MKKTLTIIVVLVSLFTTAQFTMAELLETKNIDINTGHANWEYYLTDRETHNEGTSGGIYTDWNTYVGNIKNEWKETLGEHQGNHGAFYNSAYGMTNTSEVSWIGTNTENPVYTIFRVAIGMADEQYLNLKWSADNNTAAIIFNGVDYLSASSTLKLTASGRNQSDYGGLGAFTTTTGYDASIDLSNEASETGYGEGWLYFVVQNVNSNTQASPMGLYVQGRYSQTPVVEISSSASATPEPATLVILGMGLVGAGFVARKRK